MTEAQKKVLQKEINNLKADVFNTFAKQITVNTLSRKQIKQIKKIVCAKKIAKKEFSYEFFFSDKLKVVLSKTDGSIKLYWLSQGNWSEEKMPKRWEEGILKIKGDNYEC